MHRFSTDLTKQALITAIQANLIGYWLSYKNSLHSHVFNTEELISLTTGIPNPTFNYVLRARFTGNYIDQK